MKADRRRQVTSVMTTIVSGLPRSGTSLMMQTLVAGGMSALTDGERQADADNPSGYLEWNASSDSRAGIAG